MNAIEVAAKWLADKLREAGWVGEGDVPPELVKALQMYDDGAIALQYLDTEHYWIYAPEDVDSFVALFNAALERLKIVEQSATCPCGETSCSGSWEPGCGLGNSEAHVRPIHIGSDFTSMSDFEHRRRVHEAFNDDVTFMCHVMEALLIPGQRGEQ